jgi:hypothetical protein
MHEAFSRLKVILDEKGLSAADVVRRIAEQGDRINPKSVYRLVDPEEPLEKVDMRVIGAVCQALSIGIGDVLTFDEPTIIEEMPAASQARMDELMVRHKSGSHPLSEPEIADLRRLVDEAEAVARGNARRLANRRRRLQRINVRPQRNPGTQE